MIPNALQLEAAEVREELTRVAQSRTFAGSERLVSFLQFVIEQTLQGNAGSLKESVIGSEVFGRPIDYDPKTDPIVRVQARRLRAKLETYYAEEGVANPVRLSLPKGGYVPEFGRPPAPTTVVAEAVERRDSPLGKITAAAVVLAMVAGGAFWILRPKQKERSSRPLTNYPGYQTSPAFSPDGKRVAFAWDEPGQTTYHIYIQGLNEDTPVRLSPADKRDLRPAWSPDGTRVAWIRENSSDGFDVFSMPVSGSGESKLTSLAMPQNEPPRIEFSKDGLWLYSSERSGIVRISLKTGERQQLTKPASPIQDSDVAISPDQRWIAFRRTFEAAVDDVFVMPAEGGGEARAVTKDRIGIVGFAWNADNASLVVSSRRGSSLQRLWRFPVNGGQPEVLTESSLAASYPTVSSEGRLIYASRFFDTNIWRQDLTGATPPERVIASNVLDSNPQVSRDGTKIAFRSNRTGNDQVWVSDMHGASSRRLSNAQGAVTGAAHWSPDGKWIVFDSREHGQAEVFLVAESGGEVRRLTNWSSNEVVPSFSFDGKAVYFTSDHTGGWEIWRLELAGGEPKQITRGGGFAAQESADGKWLYYSKPGDVGGVWRVPVDGGVPETNLLPKMPWALWGAWTLTGTGLVYAEPGSLSRRQPSSLLFMDLATGASKAVGTTSFPIVLRDGGLSVSPDGRFVYVSEVERAGSNLYLEEAR